LHLELQFIDTTTCEPVEDLLIDIWSCNSTGVYSGIDTLQLNLGVQGGVNTTFLRGLQVTDTDGVVEFDTLFPGH
jgi:protocatechuate 3,4-dioxygenase beta subunit